ncbi:MAG: SEC59/DGK1/VTE5 family protein [Pyrobaculum sp.]|uniref:Phosphatidate cytidylyltransferase n=1 Tax=Pyrobaculum arsenaticum TaxID=121277 RepID=A0A7L4PE27_9CREN|nr:diacylglycerol/polyprenol kinase family protein [Pyrobaculum arsenaticum]MCY0891476.1 SEC59/DGK1/VTE5 family protein [Pyrobaculum arsenaticum]NYR16150.1 phosphatidate cytidylyltransferase [Pyrobaculum arsenaticum]
MSQIEELRRLAARKMFHVAFVALLALPFVVGIPLETYTAILAFIGGVVYSIQVRQPAVWEQLREDFFKTLEDVFTRLEQLLPLDKPGVREQYAKAVRQFEELVLMAERDYEKRHGYLGILMGAVGFLIAESIFGRGHLLPALISLGVYDAVSAVAGTAMGGRRIGKVSLWGTTAGALANILALVAAGAPVGAALLITAMVVLADVVSPEDNLTIPVAAAAGSYLYHLL